ncbi:thiamine-phosphate kinase [Corynebacterium sp. 335C]
MTEPHHGTAPHEASGARPGPTVGDVGEHAVIAAIREVAPSSRNGDDAAVLAMTTPNASHVATTDLLVEGRHFDLAWSTPEDVGRKAAIQNFADVEAMGARPRALLMGLSAPESTPLDVVVGIARGMVAECDRCVAELVGGDVVGGAGLTLSITAIGEVGGPARPLMRSGARPGDRVIAAGVIGRSAAGLALLRRHGRPEDVPERFRELVDAHRVPVFSYGRGPVARAAGVNCLTDNSDGLLVDLAELARTSGVRIDLDRDAVAPDELMLDAADHLGADAWEWVLHGGEDHTLLGTTAGEPPIDFRVIGRVVRAGRSAVEGSRDAAAAAGTIPGAGTGAATGAAPAKPPAPLVTIGGEEPGEATGWVSF